MPQGSNCSFNSMKKSLGFFLEMPPLACHVSYTNVYMHGINKVYGDFSLQVRWKYLDDNIEKLCEVFRITFKWRKDEGGS